MFNNLVREKYPETTQTEQNICRWFAYYLPGHLQKEESILRKQSHTSGCTSDIQSIFSLQSFVAK